LEQTLRSRFDRAFGSYVAFDSLTELEFGITDNFQVGVYLNSGYINAHGAPDDDDPHGATGFSRSKPFLEGVAAEFIYRVMNPVKDPIGLAFYIEPELNFTDLHNGLQYNDSWGVEYKILLQKNFLDDRLVIAYNLVLETEWVRFANNTNADGETSQRYNGELDWNNEFGISYRFAENWYAGWEMHNHNEYGAFTNFEHSVFWTGPSLHYGGKKFWATLSVLTQVYGKPNGVDENGTFIGNGLFERSHEKWEIALKIGFPF
jgi:hypothetical protein